MGKIKAALTALMVQDALAIQLLIVAPMRISNLVRLDLDRHLIRSGPGTTHVVLPGHEMKNRQAMEYPLPAAVVALLDCFLREHRPSLTPAGSTTLFPARDGGPQSRHALAARVKRAVFVHTGLLLNVHLFRHASARFYLGVHPGRIEVMRRVLGHRSISTTSQFYAGFETARSVRHFDEVILRLRHKAGP